MVNGLGGTPISELYLLYGIAHKKLAEKGIKVFRSYVGEYCTSLEMAGAHISLLKVDAELKELLLAPAEIAYRVFYPHLRGPAPPPPPASSPPWGPRGLGSGQRPGPPPPVGGLGGSARTRARRWRRPPSPSAPSSGCRASNVRQRYDAAMRIKLVIRALLVIVLAACSSGSSGTASNANPSATGSQTSTSQPTETTAPAGNGKVDCTAINTAAQQLLMIQFLAQLKTPDTIESIKAKQIGNLDLDTFLAAMHDLHALDSYASPLGDPKAAIDFYEKAGKAAQVLFATDPMTQAAIDTYNQHVGTVTEFLGHQIAISGAMDAAGC